MGASRQSGFNQEVAKALVESGAIDLAKMTDVYKTFAQDALFRGEDLVLAVGKHVMINCGWPGPILRQLDLDQVPWGEHPARAAPSARARPPAGRGRRRRCGARAGRRGAGARALVPGKVLGETALLCRVTGRLLADDPSLARSKGSAPRRPASATR